MTCLLPQVFTLDTDLLNAEIETLESIPSVAEQSADLIAVKRKRLVDQVGVYGHSNSVVNSIEIFCLSHLINMIIVFIYFADFQIDR